MRSSISMDQRKDRNGTPDVPKNVIFGQPLRAQQTWATLVVENEISRSRPKNTPFPYVEVIT